MNLLEFVWKILFYCFSISIGIRISLKPIIDIYNAFQLKTIHTNNWLESILNNILYILVPIIIFVFLPLRNIRNWYIIYRQKEFQEKVKNSSWTIYSIIAKIIKIEAIVEDRSSIRWYRWRLTVSWTYDGKENIYTADFFYPIFAIPQNIQDKFLYSYNNIDFFKKAFLDKYISIDKKISVYINPKYPLDYHIKDPFEEVIRINTINWNKRMLQRRIRKESKISVVYIFIYLIILLAFLSILTWIFVVLWEKWIIS